MKSLKSLLPFLLVVFALAGCKTDDLEKDIDALTDRVTSLEAQVSLLNENLNALRVFVDGGKTITGYTTQGTAPDLTYIITLSDGETITLSQGSVGTVSTPEIEIENGNWIINGTDTGVKAEGDNGATPQFRINSEGYWEVKTTGEWTSVLDEEGNPVKATTDESIATGDQFFTNVEETTENGTTVLKVTLATGATYSLPIVENLLCEIADPTEGFSNGTWTIGYGETAKTSVKVKGDNYIVTAPAGWIATIEITNEETGEGTLTVTAPAQASAASRAAVADNSKDLTIQVNKGITWAVDKIQVEGKEIIASYKALYDAGETLTIGDLTINKETYGDAVLISDASSASITAGGVYFVEPGIEASYDNTTENSQTLIIIGNNSSRKSSLKINKQIRLIQNEGEGIFLCHNLDINASSVTNSTNATAYVVAQNGNNAFKNLLLNNCSLTLPTEQQPFTYISSSQRSFENFVVENSTIQYPTGDSKQRYFISAGSSTATYANITFKNNVFYCTDGLVQNFKFFNGQNASIGTIKVQNNTFINLGSNTTAYVYAKTTSDIQASNNLFFANTGNVNNYYIIFRLGTSATGSVSTNNIGYRADDTTQGWRMFYLSGGISSGWEGAEDIIKVETNPFNGGTFDLASGTFIPNAEYAEYGAKSE